mmetsp:Transcript_8712/g.23132  ORF Transcript_8712/g.23132 Transcript_8712/m.23132 type:complete len:201 (-) Transcript_8712:206-808(-)
MEVSVPGRRAATVAVVFDSGRPSGDRHADVARGHGDGPSEILEHRVRGDDVPAAPELQRARRVRLRGTNDASISAAGPRGERCCAAGGRQSGGVRRRQRVFPPHGLQVLQGLLTRGAKLGPPRRSHDARGRAGLWRDGACTRAWARPRHAGTAAPELQLELSAEGGDAAAAASAAAAPGRGGTDAGAERRVQVRGGGCAT